MSTPRPSYVGCAVRNWSTPVADSGINPAMSASGGGTIGSPSSGAVRLPSAGAAGVAAAFGVSGAGRAVLPPHAATATPTRIENQRRIMDDSAE